MSAPLPSPPPPTYPDRRPATRAGCLDMPRPCPFMTCRYHLAVDISKGGRLIDPLFIEFATPDELHERLAAMPHTCSLDAAEEGPQTLEAIGEPWGVSRERIRQIEVRAQADLARKGVILDLAAASDLDTTRTPIIIDDHRARLPRALPAKAPRREPGQPHLGMNPEHMTAAMRRVQEESRAACPTRTVTLSAEELADLESQIAAKRKTSPTSAPRLTSATPNQWADRRARAKAAQQSNARIHDTYKAPPTTPPRQPSPPSTTTLESPPADLPAKSKSDDQPEAAVAAALPDPAPSPPQQPMTRPDIRTRRTVYEDANETAKRNLAKIMAARGITRESLSAMARFAHPAHTPMSVDQAIVRAMNGTASPVSVWYRRIASLLGIPLSDLCSDPTWLAAVAPEDSPAAAPHSPPPHLPPLPQASPSTPPPAKADAASESTLIPLLAEAIRQAQAADRQAQDAAKRAAEQAAVIDLLRHECDDLREQLAAATKALKAATTTLADIKRRLA